MTYQVLARKWRPNTFDEVVGQDYVVKALKGALDLEKLPHAFIFSGTRGTGKTTLARILAKAINCSNSKRSLSHAGNAIHVYPLKMEVL